MRFRQFAKGQPCLPRHPGLFQLINVNVSDWLILLAVQEGTVVGSSRGLFVAENMRFLGQDRHTQRSIPAWTRCRATTGTRRLRSRWNMMPNAWPTSSMSWKVALPNLILLCAGAGISAHRQSQQADVRTPWAAPGRPSCARRRRCSARPSRPVRCLPCVRRELTAFSSLLRMLSTPGSPVSTLPPAPLSRPIVVLLLAPPMIYCLRELAFHEYIVRIFLFALIHAC